MMEAGTRAAPEFELERATTVPDGPALPLRLTVPTTLVVDPPTTDVGATVTDITQVGIRVRVQVAVVEFRLAVIVTGVLESTPNVVTVNDALVEPAGTVIELGTTTLELPELSATTVPPDPAAE